MIVSPAPLALLAVTVAGAFAYLWVAMTRPDYSLRPLIKGIPLAALSFLAMLLAPLPYGMVLMLALWLSLAGDVLLDQPNDRGFLTGLLAFLLAHLAYAFLAFLFVDVSGWGRMVLAGLIVVLGIGYVVWLKPRLGRETGPVVAYVLAILLMVVMALFCALPSPLIPLGAVLFLISDALFAYERYVGKFPAARPVIWLTYVAAQIALTVGFLTGLQAVMR